jgi:hypothetical protein
LKGELKKGKMTERNGRRWRKIAFTQCLYIEYLYVYAGHDQINITTPSKKKKREKKKENNDR